MFVAISTYQKPIEEVLKVYPDHREWLLKHYNAGRFLGSGRREPPRAPELEAFLNRPISAEGSQTA